MKKIIFSILILFIFLTPSFLYSIDKFPASYVQDISDRKYEPAVIELLDNAKESIFISMYSVSLNLKKRNPVQLLLNDLLEARQRNVSVTIYLNTKFKNNDKKERILNNPDIVSLKDAGCIIYLMPVKRRLHDKLIIVDKRYVVEGSTNWSINALRNNYESATLINSPELARVKLKRLENIIKFIEAQNPVPNSAIYL